MKRHSKILVFILALTLLIGSAFCFSALAEEEPAKKLTVISQNVEYSDTLYLYYAVYPENVDTDGLKLEIYTSNPTDEATPVATVTESTEVTITDTDNTEYVCRAFKSPGIALKDMSTQLYVKAVAADGTESSVRRYSVVEYFNEMSFTTADESRAAAYRDMLKAGDAAQLILNHYPNDNASDYASNYKYVTVTDGTLADGFDRGVYLTGTSVTPSYSGTDATKTGWNVENLMTGATEYVAFGSAIVLDAHVKITPAVKAYERGEGVYYSSKANYPTGTYLDWNFNNEGASLNGFSNYGTSSGVMTDGAATITRTLADQWKTEHFYYTPSVSQFTGDISGATCKVFEFDWKIGGFDLGSNDNRQMFRLDDNDYILLCKNSDGATYSLGKKDTATIKEDEWCNVRLEFYNVSGTKYVQIYVNNVYAYTQTLTSATNTYNNRIYFYLESSFKQVGAYISVDNLIMIYVNKDYVAH